MAPALFLARPFPPFPRTGRNRREYALLGEPKLGIYRLLSDCSVLILGFSFAGKGP